MGWRTFWHEGVEGGSGVCVLGGGGRRFWLNRWNEVLVWGVRMGLLCGWVEWASCVGGRMGFWCGWVEWGSGVGGRMGFWCGWVEWGSGVGGRMGFWCGWVEWGSGVVG